MAEDEPKHEHKYCTEVVMCERCGKNLADVVVNLRYIGEDVNYPLVALCAGCFLSVYKGSPGIQMS